MKPKTKDRLLTAGVVLVICALGFTQGGCVGAGVSQQQHQQQLYWDSICTTDTDCEMHERLGTKHFKGEQSHED